MLSQAGIARAWGPGCYKGKKAVLTLYGGGKVTIRAAALDANVALDACLRAYDYPTRPADTGALVCREKTGGHGVSNHSFGTADDLNWTTNPYGARLHTDMPMGMVRAICAIRTRSGAQVWNWGGFWSGNKDAMHFELVCSPKDLATGIDPATVPAAPPYRGGAPATDTTTQPPLSVVATDEEDDELKIISHTGDGDPAKRSLAMAIRGGFRFPLNGSDQLGAAKFETGGQVTQTNEAGWQHYLRTTKPA